MHARPRTYAPLTSPRSSSKAELEPYCSTHYGPTYYGATHLLSQERVAELELELAQSKASRK
eukprot:scaffold15768_cov84-Phaeocystis_antarctica.AAC.1